MSDKEHRRAALVKVCNHMMRQMFDFEHLLNLKP